jgi:hypothetical protein
LTREHLLADHMDAILGAGDELLKLSRTGGDIVESRPVRFRHPRYDAAYPTHRLVNDVPVLLPKLNCGGGVGGDQGVGNLETERFDPQRLVGLGVVGRHMTRPVHRQRGREFGP